MKKVDSNGFASVLVLVIIGIIAIGGVGYYVYHANKQTNKTLNQTSAQTKATHADAYAGWETFTSKYDGVSFKYPASWKLEDDSDENFGTSVYLTAKDGFSVNVGYGIERPGLDYVPKVLFAQKVSFMGKSNYLDFLGGSGSAASSASSVESVQLSTATTDPVNNAPAQGKNYADIDATTKEPEALAAAKADSNYKNVTLLIESFKANH